MNASQSFFTPVVSSSSSSSNSITEAPPHHHRHCVSLAPRDSAGSTATEHPADNTDVTLLVVSTKTPLSQRLRTLHSRRSNADCFAGDSESPLGVVRATDLTLCCDSVSVQLNQRDVIDEVSCLFRGGRVTAVVNCCGTHTAFALLAVMAGMLESAAGNVVLNGIPVSASTYQAQTSFLEDGGEISRKEEESSSSATVASDGFLVELTVRENLQYTSALRVANSAQAYSVEEVLQQLLLRPHETSKIKDCSLYVRRRVALGRALLLNPSVLLLDEPLEGLATHESQQYLTILSKLAAPSVADAEARHVMRQAMSAAAAAAASEGGASTRVTVNLATTSGAGNVSLYTPRHSRLRFGPPARQSTPRPASPTDAPITTAATSTDLASRAEAQRIVVLSMVQPRWALLQYVHDVVLLERSRCIFAGSVRDMLAVKLPKDVMRASMAARANGGGELTDEPGSHAAGIAAAVPSTPPRNLFTAAPANSYDAVDASIQHQRLGERIVHGLYRLATSTTAPAVGDDGSESDEGDAAAAAESGFAPIINAEGHSDAPVSRRSVAAALAASASSSLFIGVNADGPPATALSHMYAHRQARMRASVTAYMEACAMGLVELPEVFHESPSSVVQLLHLLRFGFLELRRNFIWNIFSLVCGLALTSVLAALYGRQGGQEGMQNRVGIVFFLVSCVVLQAVLSLDALRREYATFQRYTVSGYYGVWTYLVFRAITAALWRFGLASFVALAVFVLSNFGDPWHEYRGIFELSVILAVTSFCSHFGVWFLCTWLPSDHVGRFVVFTFYTLNIILAGLVLNLQTLPDAVRAISFASVVRLAYESCILTQFIGKSFGCHDDGTAGANGASPRVTTAAPLGSNASAHQNGRASSLSMQGALRTLAVVQTTACYTGSEYAEFLGFNPSRRWSNVAVLAVMSALLLMGSWIMMALNRPRRRFKMHL
ncbi:ABC transporter/ABC-2 type transporter, putative [Leishmania guyanensis]